MDARPKSVRDILHTGDQYIIPLFQRYYSWEKENWDRLRKDIWALMEDESKPVHFLGPLVCTPTGHFPGAVPAYQLIDGQQRLTTLTLLLAALRNVAVSRNLPNLAEEIAEDYLIHKRKTGTEHYKILPRLGDREALQAIINGNDLLPYQDNRLFGALKYFHRHAEHWARNRTEEGLRQLLDTVTRRLALVVVTIDGESPYEIFESLNSKGLPLEEADLIRNFIFMQVPLSKQQEFFDQHWKALEEMFDASETSEAIPMTPFYRDYLMKDGRYSKEDATFLDFKEHQKQAALTPEQQVKELSHFAVLDLMLRRPQTANRENLRRLLTQIAGMEIATSYPLLLNLLDRTSHGRLSKEDLEGCLQDLVSFVLRRSICGETTRSYGQWFVEAISVLRDNPRQDLRMYWLNRRWPDDFSLRDKLCDFPIYRREGRKARVILEEIEDSYKHKEKVDTGKLSIEHVMPQTLGSNSAGRNWKTMLGDGWQEVHEKYLHSLGNLTLTGYNPDLSNSSFERKKELLHDSHLELNKYFSSLTTWTEEAIRNRADKLAHIVAQLWPRPASNIEYSPSAEAVREPEGLSERQKKYLEYWRHLDTRLEERGLPADVIIPKPSNLLAIRIGTTGSAEIQLAFNQQRKQVSVGLNLTGEIGESIESRLLGEKGQIEKDLGYSLEWESGDIYIADEGVGLWDQEDWPIQHDWMGDHLEDYLRAFKPRVEKLEEEVLLDPGLRRKTEKRERLVGSPSRNCINEPDRLAAHAFQYSNAGRIYCRFQQIDTGVYFGAQYFDSEGGWIGIYFGVSKKAGRRLRTVFKDLAEDHRSELENVIGEELEWSDPYLSIYMQSDLEAKDDWPQQHDWIRIKAEKLLAEFTKRLNLE
jgi:uncharacterized protein with ParB-like and HNH nuclease domain